jgi:hypothetical protein
MTQFEALVSMAQTVLRARGEWHQGATAHDDIVVAVYDCANAIRGGTDIAGPDVSRDVRQAAIRELKLRATPAV